MLYIHYNSHVNILIPEELVINVVKSLNGSHHELSLQMCHESSKTEVDTPKGLSVCK